jgi:thiol-disulfide isomerase/thioredoxin
MRLAHALLLLLFAAPSLAADGPYDESADARLEVERALADAAVAKASVLVVFGANWCADCKILDMTMRKDPTSALVAREFKVVKVDVGRFDRNVDLASAYGAAEERHPRDRDPLAAPRGALRDPCRRARRRPQDGRRGHPRVLQACRGFRRATMTSAFLPGPIGAVTAFVFGFVHNGRGGS